MLDALFIETVNLAFTTPAFTALMCEVESNISSVALLLDCCAIVACTFWPAGTETIFADNFRCSPSASVEMKLTSTVTLDGLDP